ncbi:NIPSNAP family protein [Rubrolithibacter danxiaensis]|uniref:NIPSNAP family protein n=1 Tax=Rubrolithibacter danxiaensis TaxID=3390805 RepID=UPI003BF80E72
MKRRDFVRTSVLGCSLAGIAPVISKASEITESMEKQSLEFYELRVYTLKNEAQQKLVEDYFKNAAIPALNKIGSRNVGVFTELKPEGFTKLYALIPYKSMDDFLRSSERLSQDKKYAQAAAAYLNAPATAPAYERIESSLLRAFTGMPKIEVPSKKSRIFELRRYESPSESAGKKKIEMFNTAGEISIFKRTGLTPVFFGETLIGPQRPNLTYMITFDDMDEHDRNWKQFGSDPEWKKISSMPEYADAKIISHINATFLKPVEFSQI